MIKKKQSRNQVQLEKKVPHLTCKLGQPGLPRQTHKSDH
jgi:hypothetical protein